MTNAEAIETLIANYPDVCDQLLREAVDTAIEALKVQDKTSDGMRLIDANEIKKRERDIVLIPSGAKHRCFDTTMLFEIPTVDAEPVKHGHWIRNDNGTYSCRECKSWIPNEQHYYARYCLFCGAKMDEQETYPL